MSISVVCNPSFTLITHLILLIVGLVGGFVIIYDLIDRIKKRGTD